MRLPAVSGVFVCWEQDEKKRDCRGATGEDGNSVTTLEIRPKNSWEPLIFFAVKMIVWGAVFSYTCSFFFFIPPSSLTASSDMPQSSCLLTFWLLRLLSFLRPSVSHFFPVFLFDQALTLVKASASYLLFLFFCPPVLLCSSILLVLSVAHLPSMGSKL